MGGSANRATTPASRDDGARCSGGARRQRGGGAEVARAARGTTMSAPTYGSAVFRWNGSVVSFVPGDSVAAALYRSGIRTLASTRKRHLPLGFSGTYVQGVLGRVDGR